jgi:hypothetical protein
MDRIKDPSEFVEVQERGESCKKKKDFGILR